MSMNFNQIRDNFMKEAKERMVALENKQSQYDTIISDALHFLENEKCDAVAMVKISKYLQSITKKRRKVKVEHDKLSGVISAATINAEKLDERTYTYRTNNIQDICKQHYKIKK